MSLAGERSGRRPAGARPRPGARGLRKVRGIGAAMLAAVAGAGSSPAPDAALHRGMTLGLFSVDDPGRIEASLDEIRDLGADAISLVVPKVVPDIRSLQIGDGEWVTPSDAALRTAIRAARRRGMRVLLLPILFVERMGAGEWRGTLAPPDWDDWFRRYGDVIRHYARLAASEGVEVLSVGSELCSTEAQDAHWRKLIASVREVYGGRLLYSANWDHYRDIPFLEALDYLGINAYYQLASTDLPEVEELRRAWKPVQTELIAWSRRHGRRLLFTEVGYPSRAGAASDPWDYAADRPVSLEAQRRCYRAFIDTWREVPELAGVFFYLWWGEGGPEDRGYTPRRKPAEDEVSGWFGGAKEGQR